MRVRKLKQKGRRYHDISDRHLDKPNPGWFRHYNLTFTRPMEFPKYRYDEYICQSMGHYENSFISKIYVTTPQFYALHYAFDKKLFPGKRLGDVNLLQPDWLPAIDPTCLRKCTRDNINNMLYYIEDDSHPQRGSKKFIILVKDTDAAYEISLRQLRTRNPCNCQELALNLNFDHDALPPVTDEMKAVYDSVYGVSSILDCFERCYISGSYIPQLEAIFVSDEEYYFLHALFDKHDVMCPSIIAFRRIVKVLSSTKNEKKTEEKICFLMRHKSDKTIYSVFEACLVLPLKLEQFFCELKCKLFKLLTRRIDFMNHIHDEYAPYYLKLILLEQKLATTAVRIEKQRNEPYTQKIIAKIRDYLKTCVVVESCLSAREKKHMEAIYLLCAEYTCDWLHADIIYRRLYLNTTKTLDVVNLGMNAYISNHYAFDAFDHNVCTGGGTGFFNARYENMILLDLHRRRVIVPLKTFRECEIYNWLYLKGMNGFPVKKIEEDALDLTFTSVRDVELVTQKTIRASAWSDASGGSSMEVFDNFSVSSKPRRRGQHETYIAKFQKSFSDWVIKNDLDSNKVVGAIGTKDGTRYFLSVFHFRHRYYVSNCDNCEKLYARYKCKRCKSAHYCSRICQKIGWITSHKNDCPR